MHSLDFSNPIEILSYFVHFNHDEILLLLLEKNNTNRYLGNTVFDTARLICIKLFKISKLG